MLSFRVNTASVKKMLGGIGARARDTEGITRRWLGFMRKKAKERFAELGGPPLAESTRKKYEEQRTSSVTAQGQVRASYIRNRERQIRGKYMIKEYGVVGDRGKALIAELHRLANGGSPAFTTLDVADKSIDQLRKKLQRAQKTGKRVGGNRRKIDRHKLLGRLVGALEGASTALAAILRNRVPWSRVHNEGGEVGNNAQEPARTTLQILVEDVAELAKIQVQHLLGIKGKGKR